MITTATATPRRRSRRRRNATEAEFALVRELLTMLGSFTYDADAIATLTGVASDQIAAWARLGLIGIYDGRVWNVR